MAPHTSVSLLSPCNFFVCFCFGLLSKSSLKCLHCHCAFVHSGQVVGTHVVLLSTPCLSLLPCPPVSSPLFLTCLLSGRRGTHCVAKAGLELAGVGLPVSWVPRFQASAAMPHFFPLGLSVFPPTFSTPHPQDWQIIFHRCPLLSLCGWLPPAGENPVSGQCCK